MNNKERLEQVKEEMPETIKRGLARKVKNSNKEDFDVEEAIEDICDSQIEFFNHFKSNDRFREKFSEMMFKQYLELK